MSTAPAPDVSLADALQRMTDVLAAVKGVEPPDRTLKTREAARLLQVNEETVQAMAKDGLIPAVLYGRGWKFSERALRHWLYERCQANLLRHTEPAPLARVGQPLESASR